MTRGISMSREAGHGYCKRAFFLEILEILKKFGIFWTFWNFWKFWKFEILEF
jgi:hypothetical protein